MRKPIINKKTAKRLKYGGFATAITALVIAALVIVNIIAGALNDRYPLSLDMTSNSFYTLDKKTEEFINAVNKEIDIYVLGTRDNVLAGEYFSSQSMYDLTATRSYMKNLINTFERAASASDRINVSYVDLTRNPAFAAEYYGAELRDGSVLVRCGDRYRVLDYSDLFTTDVGVVDESYIFYITSSTAEQALCSAITNVTSDDQNVVTVLTGHGDDTSSGLTSLLLDNNFDVRYVDINTEDIPPESSFVVINTPQTDYTEAEISKLTAYLENAGEYGRNLMMFFDVSQRELPKLEKFAEDRGISVSRDTIYETDTSKIYGEGIFFRTEYATDDYAHEALEDGKYVSVIGSRAVDRLFEDSGQLRVTTLLSSSSESAVRPSDADSTWTADGAEKGAFGVLVLSEDDPYNDPYRASRVYVWGSGYVVSESFLNNASYANSSYLSSLFNTVTNNDRAVDIPPKENMSYTVSMTASQVNTIGLVIFTIVVPAAMLATGAIVYFRRRRL